MKRLLVLSLLLVIIGCSLHAQYNEKDIIYQQAYQLMSQRQYAQSEQLLIQVLDKYPNDLNSINLLLQIYFALMQTDKAETLLNKYQRVMPQQVYTEQYIQLLVLQAKVEEAWEQSMAYLELFNHEEFRYRQLAAYFERKGFYDRVLQLYRMARTRLNKPNLFTLEIANASMNYRLFNDAIHEYLAYLTLVPSNLFFTNNQIKAILQEDPTLLSSISAIADTSKSEEVKELYAGALVSLKDYKTALSVYKKLELSKLYRFAEEQASSGSDSLAYAAYQYALEVETDPLKLVDISYRMAEISYTNADYSAALWIINNAITLPLWNDRNKWIKSQYGVKLRRLLAEIQLSSGAQVDSAIICLNDARKYARDNFDRQDIDLEIARLYLMRNEKQRANAILQTIKEPRLNEGKAYLLFLGELLSGSIEYADSLMNDFVIKYPGSSYTNDAMYLMMLTLGLQGDDTATFFTAIQLIQLNQESGLDSLLSVFERNKDEELLLLAVETAIGLGLTDRAMSMLNYQFTDPIAAEYTSLLKLSLLNDPEAEQQLARDFLKTRPNSIFSPGFRQRISRWSASRPAL